VVCGGMRYLSLSEGRTSDAYLSLVCVEGVTLCGNDSTHLSPLLDVVASAGGDPHLKQPDIEGAMPTGLG
jgi:hypothetical protein